VTKFEPENSMSVDEASIDQLLAYCASLAEEFEARRNRIRNFVSHNLTSGTANEAILRNLLASISSGKFDVSEGFICNPLKSLASRQCDILVHDTRFPLVYSEAGLTIVWPEAAQMVIEVKTSMKRPDVERAVENIVAAKQTEGGARRLIGIVFAFRSPTPEAVLKTLREYEGDPLHRPVAIILFDKGVIIQQADLDSALRYGGGDSEYQLRQCIGDRPGALTLAYLLLLFLHPQFSYAGGFSSYGDLLTVTGQFLREHTRLIPVAV
jgi:hypothetical protein